jgi:hypothetical protein
MLSCMRYIRYLRRARRRQRTLDQPTISVNRTKLAATKSALDRYSAEVKPAPVRHEDPATKLRGPRITGRDSAGRDAVAPSQNLASNGQERPEDLRLRRTGQSWSEASFAVA